MKILLAPDKFKGSASAAEVCLALKTGIHSKMPEADIISKPIADGGEGSLLALGQSLNSEKVILKVNDPLFREIETFYLKREESAYIEMASAAGLHLLEALERNPEKASTYGVGQLIDHAIRNGATKIYLFVGGSATNDGGIGMAQAMGYSFLDTYGNEIDPNGQNLLAINKIMRPKFLSNIELKVLCDVQNVLYGSGGAAFVYGQQKGANKEMIIRLDKGLKNLADKIKKDLGKDVSMIKGGGAAGGIAAGAVAFFDAEILPGIESIMEIVGMEEMIRKADFVVTGEGKIDKQTLSGKVVAGMASKARQFNVPIVAVCGLNELNKQEKQKLGLQNIYALVNQNVDSEFAMRNTKVLLCEIGKQIALSLQ